MVQTVKCYLLVSVRLCSWLLLLTDSWALLDRWSLSYMNGVARQEAKALRWSSVTGCLTSLSCGADSVHPNCSKHSPAGIKPRAQTNSSMISSACSTASASRSGALPAGGGGAGASSMKACRRCAGEEQRRRPDIEPGLCREPPAAGPFCKSAWCESLRQAFQDSGVLLTQTRKLDEVEPSGELVQMCRRSLSQVERVVTP